MVVFELTFPVVGCSTSSPLRVRLPIEPGDYTITVDAGADVEIKRCVRADDDPTWSSGSAVDVTAGAFTIEAVTDRRLLADVIVTADAPIEVCRIELA